MGKWWAECKHPTDELVRFDAYKILYKRLMHQLAPYLDHNKVRNADRASKRMRQCDAHAGVWLVV